MPHFKRERTFEPLWRDWDRKAQKCGVRNTIYSVKDDQYTGEWSKNLKHGKGSQKWKDTGAIYEGDWAKGKRNGYGTYSLPIRPGQYKKLYSGGWKNDKRHGYGMHFYSDDEYYEGEWYADERSGWGRMYYADGSIYEGEWLNDQKNGSGMSRLENENRYEGLWKNDMKNGNGKFFYLDKGQIYEGFWVNDIPKCGSMRDFGREGAPEQTQYPIPEIKLCDYAQVLAEAEDQFALE